MSRKGFLSVVYFCALWAPVGCDREPWPSDELASYQWPIVGGTREPGEDAVVMIYNRGYGCTASVISPRVVLTAKHCCQVGSASGWQVLVGASAMRPIDEYGVTSQRTTPGSSIEESDICVLLLNRDFAWGFKRWEFLPWPGFHASSPITAIGYGQTNPDDAMSAGTKYRKDGNVVTVTGYVEFITQGENTCQGDSGGPILYQDVVTGIVSRGEAGCTGRGIMTRVSGFADLINRALIDSGGCVPTAFEFCNGLDDDCWNGPDDALGPTCACSDGGARGTEVCNGVDDDCNATIDDLANCACTGGAAPGTETCNGIDDDCNGVIDDPCARLGEPCGVDADCSTRLCMDTGTGIRVCSARCVAGSGAPCPDGGYCDGTACGEGFCRPAGEGGTEPLGAPCTIAANCLSRFCAPRPDGATVCTHGCTPGSVGCLAGEACWALVEACGACMDGDAVPPPRAFGEPCRTDVDCASGYCLIDGDPAACGADCPYRYCTASCGAAGECPAGAHCRDGICVLGTASDPGDTCMTDADCLAGTCIPPGGGGRCIEGCTPAGTCASGFVCMDSYCVPDGLRPGDLCAAPGDPCMGGVCASFEDDIVCVSRCTDVTDCDSGLVCVPGVDGSGICVPTSLAGGPPAGDGCNCSVSRRASPAAALDALLLAGLWLARGLTRRRRPR